MKITSKLRYLRIAPRKVRLVVDSMKGKSVGEAQTALSFMTKKGSLPVLKLLKQAVANAKDSFQVEEDNLYISEIRVDEGPKYKRWMPRARGSAYEIQKKTSHVTLVLDTIKPTKEKKRKKAKKKTAETIKEVSGEKEIKRPKPEKPKLKPEVEKPKPKTKVEKDVKKVFRRKAF